MHEDSWRELFTDVWRSLRGLPPILRIDPQRLNVEECRLRRYQMELDLDEAGQECIARVRRRMLEGSACNLPPYYNKKGYYAAQRRKRRLERARLRVVMQFPKKEEAQ